MARRPRTGFVVDYRTQVSSSPQVPTGEILEVEGTMSPYGDTIVYPYKDTGTTRWVLVNRFYATRDEAVAAARKGLEAAVRRARGEITRAERDLAVAEERLRALA